MKFRGSKRRIAKYILPIMLGHRKSLKQYWVEPFVGGGNIIENVKGNRIGADSHLAVIEALISIRDHVYELPKSNKEFTKEDYIKAKGDRFSYAFRSYVGFVCSFGGKWFDGWAADSGGRDYVAEAYRSALKQSPKLQGAELLCADYDKLTIPPNSLIYCDPPYANTRKYKGVGKFNHEKFWEWCREKAKEGHTIFISEYNAPSDFKCIWSKELTCMLNKDKYKRNIEKLFIPAQK